MQERLRQVEEEKNQVRACFCFAPSQQAAYRVQEAD